MIGLFILRLDLSPNFESELDRCGCHALNDERSDDLIDRRSGNRLAVRLAARAMTPIANIPGLLSSSARGVADTKVPSAAATNGASLQERRPFSRWRRTRCFVRAAIGLEDLQIALKLLPTDIAGMSIG